METNHALQVLTALAHENRLAVFRLLVEHGPEGLTAGTIAERLGMAPATLSFHVKELAAAKLVLSRQVGRFIWYRANFDVMNNIVAFLTENCCRSSSVCDAGCAPAVRSTPRKRASNSRS